MPVAIPTAPQFKARYSEFDVLADDRVVVFLEDAADNVNETWADVDIPRGIMAYAAHLLTLEGEPGRTAANCQTSADGSEVASLQAGRVVKRMTVGDVTEEYEDASAETVAAASSTSSIIAGATGLERTNYGLRYLELLHRNISSVYAL